MVQVATVDKDSVQNDVVDLIVVGSTDTKAMVPTVVKPLLPAIGTLEELAADIRRCHQDGNKAHIGSYWYIGKRVNAYYEKSYGDDEMKTLAGKTGIAIGTLYKACQFAEKYSDEHLAQLFDGEWQLSWRMIAQNLTIDPDQFVKAFKESDSKRRFNNAVRKLKSPKTRAKKTAKKATFIVLNSEYNYLIRNQIACLKQQVNEKDAEIMRLKEQMAKLQKESMLAPEDEEGSEDIITD
jgi:hypothetical protein